MIGANEVSVLSDLEDWSASKEELEVPNEIEDLEEYSRERSLNFWKGQNREINTNTIEYSLPHLADLVQRKKINMEPKYQRRHRWDNERQSKLIESFVMHVPVPPIYLNEDRKGILSVIDGKQRLNTIWNFFLGGLRLEGLTIFEDLNGLTLNELPPDIQDDLITVPSLRAIILLRHSGEPLKFEVFQRLNTGGVQLNTQEIRNSTYPGPLNDLVLELCENEKFYKLLGISNKYKSKFYQTMRDAEFVLRFLALRNNWDLFSGSFKHTMNDFMFKNQYMGKNQINEARSIFLGTLDRVEACFGEYAFKRWQPEKKSWRLQVNVSLYDAEMFGCMGINASDLDRFRPQILNGFKELFEEENFKRSIASGTNARSSLIYRINAVRDLIAELVGD